MNDPADEPRSVASCNADSCPEEVTKSRIITTYPRPSDHWAESGSLYLDEMGGVWRKGFLDEFQTVDTIRLGSIEGRCRVEPAEEEDLDRLRLEWERVSEESAAERRERWSEFWLSR